MDHDYPELRPPSQEQIDEFDAIISQFREHPETWNQQVWLVDPESPVNECTTPDSALVEVSCGTAGCVAGWLAARNQVALWFEEGLMSSPYVDDDGSVRRLPDWAAEHLALPRPYEWHDGHPFDPGATLAEMEQWLDWMRLAHKLGVDVVEARRLYLVEERVQAQRLALKALEEHMAEVLGIEPESSADEDEDEGE